MKGADLKLRINQAIILLLSILSCGQCQVTTSISQVTLRLLPDTYTEINLIS